VRSWASAMARLLLSLSISATLLSSVTGLVPTAATPHAAAAAARCSRAGPVVLGRKGRPKMPQGMGGAQQMQQGAPSGPPPDGQSVFYLYCRTGPGKPWYPVSAMKGDGQSKGLIQAWLNAPVGKTAFKDRLDEGMARSIYDSERRLASMATEQYRQLKDYQSRLQWGFKIQDADVMAKEASGAIEKQKIVPVSKAMVEKGSVVDQATSAFSGLSENLKLPDSVKDVKLPKMPWS